MCPVCTVAVAGGLGLSRWLGIDDTISGLWIGALILSISFWLSRWLEKKFHLSKSQVLLIVVIYLLVFIPLNWFIEIKKLIIGSTVGSIVFLLALRLDKKIRQAKGKQLINYQKIVIPLCCLSLASIFTYFLVK